MRRTLLLLVLLSACQGRPPKSTAEPASPLPPALRALVESVAAETERPTVLARD